MLSLKILENVTIVGQEYKAGDEVKVNKTLVHREVSEQSSSIKAMLDGDLIEAVTGKTNTFKVLGDVTVTVAGQEYKKDAEFVCPPRFDYIDETVYPAWIAEGVSAGLWALDDGTIAVTGVTMSDATITLEVGATKKLTATVLPANATDKSGLWMSADSAIATVIQDGTVEGVAAGTVELSFVTTDGAKKGTTVATITVAVIVPTSVSVSPASPTCAVGATVKLSSAITPANSTDKTGVWASADETVATVDQTGLVTGVKAGTSVVSFTTNSGAKSASRTVTITE